MINAIIGAISIALNSEFGDRYKICMEEKKQDLEKPCFFIQCLNPTKSLSRGKRYFRRNQFCIQYFPEAESGRNRECNSVAERMNDCLECIAVGVPIRGTKRNHKTVNGVLNYFVNYDCYVYKREETAAMEEMSSKTILKEGDGNEGKEK